jgi:hypothetical protein
MPRVGQHGEEAPHDETLPCLHTAVALFSSGITCPESWNQDTVSQIIAFFSPSFTCRGTKMKGCVNNGIGSSCDRRVPRKALEDRAAQQPEQTGFAMIGLAPRCEQMQEPESPMTSSPFKLWRFFKSQCNCQQQSVSKQHVEAGRFQPLLETATQTFEGLGFLEEFLWV